jgi:hypothetical protein
VTAAREALAAATAVIPHTDADGLSAGAIALRSRGEGADAALLVGRGRTPFDADAPLPPGLQAILDWGVRELDRPALMVDHHAPDPVGDRHVVVSGYGEEPQVSTSVLMRRLVPDAPAWLAALGAYGDLVNFSVRGGSGDLRAWLASALPGGGSEFARGHDRATGGSLAGECFDDLVAALRIRAA